MRKKKTQQKKRVQYTYTKNWNKINLIPTVLLLTGTLLTVMFVSAKTFYDFRQRAQTPSPTVVPSPVLEEIHFLSPTPTPTGFQPWVE
jgi:hypothetical protein